MASAATLSATTLEGQLLECIELIAGKQADTNTNPDGVTVVTTYTRNMATGAITVTATIPTEDSIGAGGSVSVNAASVYID